MPLLNVPRFIVHLSPSWYLGTLPLATHRFIMSSIVGAPMHDPSPLHKWITHPPAAGCALSYQPSLGFAYNEDSQLIQGQFPSQVASSKDRSVRKSKGLPPCPKSGQLRRTILASELPTGSAEPLLWLHCGPTPPSIQPHLLPLSSIIPQHFLTIILQDPASPPPSLFPRRTQSAAGKKYLYLTFHLRKPL